MRSLTTGKRPKWATAVKLAAVMALALFAAGVGARWVWHHRVDRLLDRLGAQQKVNIAAVNHATLPPPVARYLAAASPARRARVTRVDLDTAGEFLISPVSGWKPFHARQRFNTVTPGFVWDARIQMAPLMPVFVRDSYVAGRGEMVARVLAMYAVANEAGAGDLAEGQLARYAAEMIWFPTALRPEYGVTWTPIDDHSALAHFADGGRSIVLRFTFNNLNDVIEVFAPVRMRAVNGRQEPTPWAVRCWDHGERLGLRIPIAWEAEWRLPDGPLPYWRGRVTNIRFE